MPINRLGPKPSVSSADRAAGAGSIATNANFQGRNVSVAGQQQLESFLPEGGAQHASHTFSSTNKYISARNITAASEARDYEEMNPSNESYVNVAPSARDYEEPRSSARDYEEPRSSARDYEEPRPSARDYEEPRPSARDYEEPRPSARDYEEPQLQGHDYEEPQLQGHDYEEPQLQGHDYEEPQLQAHDYEEPQLQGHDYEEPQPLAHDYEEPQLQARDYEEPQPSAHDYEEPQPSAHDYEEPQPSAHDYEEPQLQARDYEEPQPSAHDYEEPQLQARDYEEPQPSAHDYEEITPTDENYINTAPSANDYEEMNLPTDSYREMRSVVDSPKSNRARLKRSELIKMKQLGAECGNYMKEVTGDLQKMTYGMRNLATLPKDDILAFKDYVIPQHIKCASDYSKALQVLLKSGKYEPGQRKQLQQSNQQLVAMRAKLLEAQGVLEDAIQSKNFSTQAASNYADLKAEETSPANQLMQVQSQILDIHRAASEIRYRVNYLGGDSPPTGRKRGKEELVEIAACRNDLVALKTGLSQYLSEMKQAMDTINDYEARVREQPPAAGEQRTLRERRYTMHLANRLENRIKNINNMISDSWDKLKKMT